MFSTQFGRFALFSLILLTIGMIGCSGKKMESVQIGNAAPEFSLSDQTGKTHNLAGHGGRVVLIRFWADWCPNCKEEMPKIDEVYKKLKNKGFTVIAINVKQSEEAVAAFVKEYGISFPTPLDKEAVTAGRYGVIGLPTTFIIDKNGKIMEKVMGDMTKEDVERLVTPLL